MANTEPLDYYEQEKRNSEKFSEAFKSVRPDIWALMDVVDKTEINWTILWKVAYALHHIATDTRYGQVVIEVEDNTVRFVRGIHANKVNEPLLLKKETLAEIKLSDKVES